MKRILTALFALLVLVSVANADGLTTTPGQRAHLGGKVNLRLGGTNADLSGTGGTSQVLQQSSAGAKITVGQLAASDLSNGTSGSGAVALVTNPVFVTPNLGTPSALVGTNITGTAASLTAGTVTTNANLTGPITSVGNAVASLTAHNVLTGNGTGAITSVAPGASGNVLKSNGTDWTSGTVTAGTGPGTYTSICATTPGAVTTSDCTSLSGSLYRDLVVTWSGISSTVGARTFEVQVSVASTFTQTFANYAGVTVAGTPGTAGYLANSTPLCDSLQSPASAATTWKGYLVIHDYANTTSFKDYTMYTTDSGAATHLAVCQGVLETTSAIDGVRMYWSGSGNFDAGSYTVYGRN